LGIIDTGNPSAGYIKVDAIQMIKHEEYDPVKIFHDIALLKLPSPVTLTGYKL